MSHDEQIAQLRYESELEARKLQAMINLLKLYLDSRLQEPIQ